MTSMLDSRSVCQARLSGLRRRAGLAACRCGDPERPESTAMSTFFDLMSNTAYAYDVKDFRHDTGRGRDPPGKARVDHAGGLGDRVQRVRGHHPQPGRRPAAAPGAVRRDPAVDDRRVDPRLD